MNKTQEALKVALEVLENSKLTHYYCEDIWYSCPKHEEGCANEAEGDECTCGADKANAEIEKALAAIREALAEQQEPFGYFRYDLRLDAWVQNRAGLTGTPFYTSPPAKPWVGLTDEEIAVIAAACGGLASDFVVDVARAIEQAHGITGETK